MDIQEALTELNLSPREAAIYTELLGIEHASPAFLARRTGFKRSTIYLDLESLRRKKLVGLAFAGKRTVYAAESPTHLLQSIKQQEKTAVALLPYLQAKANHQKGKPQIRYYDDPKDIKRVWVEETFNAKDNDYVSHYVDTLTEFADLEEKYQAKINDGTIQKNRELHPYTPESISFSLKHAKKNRPIRIMPAGMQFDVDISVWEDSVALYSQSGKYMLVIRDAAIAQSYHTLIDMAWQVSLTPQEAEKQLRVKK
ncbi:MAG: helix-turn-helix domain-containing protein [Patescibacteria group bacterium]|jgi:sugar-specific transcriptional regulator TrmB